MSFIFFQKTEKYGPPLNTSPHFRAIAAPINFPPNMFAFHRTILEERGEIHYSIF